MTGAEHYAEAERLVDDMEHWPASERDSRVACAQVHATLAVAAAQGANRCPGQDGYAQRCALETGHEGLHSIPVPTAERAWA